MEPGRQAGIGPAIDPAGSPGSSDAVPAAIRRVAAAAGPGSALTAEDASLSAGPAPAPPATVDWPLQRPGGGAPASGPSPRPPALPGAPASAGPAHTADGKPLRAVALRYDPFAGPPRVVASGRGHVAEALLARAREAGVPIEAQPDLVEVLMTLRIDQVIPPALYVAVAQVLAWAYLVDERVGRQRPGIEPPRR